MVAVITLAVSADFFNGISDQADIPLDFPCAPSIGAVSESRPW
jgi:hypothetical protein